MTKKLLLLAIGLLTFACGMQAKTIPMKKSLEYYPIPIPAQYCANNIGLLTAWTEDATSAHYAIYDESLEEMASFNTSDNSHLESYTEVSHKIWKYSPTENPNFKHSEVVEGFFTEKEALEYISEAFLGEVSKADYFGATWYYATPYRDKEFKLWSDEYYKYRSLFINPNIFGCCAYPRIAYFYDSGNHTLIETTLSEDAYTSTNEWSDPKIVSEIFITETATRIRLVDCNLGFSQYNHDMLITQTLFNDDEAFEYIVPVYSSYSARENWGGEGASYKSVSYTAASSQYAIKSSNGTEVATISFDGYSTDSSRPDIYQIGNKTYFVVHVRPIDSPDYSSSTEESWFYEIERTKSGVRIADRPVKMKVSPRIVGQDETVNVEFGEEPRNGNISVVDTQGRTLYRQPIDNNSHYQIPASKLNTGMNIICVESDKGAESEKVIVR